MKINLASNSPRRAQLLKQIGINFELVHVEIDETWDGNESAKTYVKRMALEKAQAAKSKIKNKLPILAADTCVLLSKVIFGKAETKQDVITMLSALSGKTHYVYTAVALITTTEITETEQICLNINQVSFRLLTETEILQYSETEEPLGKAGAYAIQGKAAIFIKHLEGSYSGVMGLPLYDTSELLNAITDIESCL